MDAGPKKASEFLFCQLRKLAPPARKMHDISALGVVTEKLKISQDPTQIDAVFSSCT